MAYEINYDDKRFTEVEADKDKALGELNETYDKMISDSDKFYQDQIDASKDWADKQSQLQQEKTDFAIEKIEQEKDQAKKDYLKEQSGAYVDWQKQSNQYGANAEAMAAQGMQNTGFAESSQVSMYNTYQNRYVAARESFNRAVLNYNNSITEARLQNNAVLAEIAAEALKEQLQLALQGFQYKNTLVQEKANKKMQIDSEYHSRYQDVLKQINTENAMAEEVRQFNEQMAFEREQYEYAKSKASSGGGGGGGSKSSGGSSGLKINKNAVNVTPGIARAENDTSPSEISNRNGNGWVEVPGHGRFTYAELLDLVEDGQVKETVSDGKLKYTWVTKKETTTTKTTKVVSPYEFKQKQLYNTLR